MNQIIVSNRDQATTSPDIYGDAKWIVEGDFGFLAAFDTRREAYEFAKAEAAGGFGDVEVQCNE